VENNPLFPTAGANGQSRASVAVSSTGDQRNCVCSANGDSMARSAPEFGKFKTVYNRFRRWVKSGLWSKIVESLIDRLLKEGKIDFELWCADRFGRADAASSSPRVQCRFTRQQTSESGSGRQSVQRALGQVLDWQRTIEHGVSTQECRATMSERRTNEWPIRPPLYCIAEHKHRIVSPSLADHRCSISISGSSGESF